MKKAAEIILLVILTFSGTTGCAHATPAPKVDPPTATALPTPTQDIGYGPWELVQAVTYSHGVNVAGFLNDSFGITVGGYGEVHYTTDGGKTWPWAVNSSMCRFGLDIVDETTAWHCGNGGTISISTDGGRTWQEAGKFGNNEPDQCRYMSFLDDTTGWAASPDQLGSTIDGGKTWKVLSLPEGIQKIAAIRRRTASDGYILDSAGTLFTTQDSGQSWSKNSLGLGADEQLSIYPTPQSVLYFTDANQGVVVYTLANQQVWSARTMDGGKTWQRQQMPKVGMFSALYLSPNGRYLTVTTASFTTITLLRSGQP